MDLLIVAFYTLCDDLLIQKGYQDDPRTKMSAAEMMTTALVAAELFGQILGTIIHSDMNLG